LVPFILLTHVIEIWVFTAGYLLAMQLGLGTLAGDFNNTLQEVAYFSAVTYTTVGFGDIVPQGDLRLLVGTEALAGLVLITWSASFTFIEMQRFWRD
ncbi:MAG: ion channel, partial [Gammaproteobacteria bacterium]|nr:ion channel [Gammaproteobacteria bacterium]